MKIVHLISSFNTGGAETMLIDIVKEQSSRGHEVTLIIINDSYTASLVNQLEGHARVIKIGRKEGSRDPSFLLRINYRLWKIWPDAIHIHNNQISRLLFCPRPKYLTVHDLNISLSTTCKKLTTIFAISDVVSKDIESMYPGQYHVIVVPNGINTAAIHRKSEMGHGTPFRIIQVARLDTEKKGQDLLIKAIAILVREKGIYLHVDFIGDGYSRNYLERITTEEGVDEYIHFLGLKDRAYIYEHLKDYDLMCHPSRFEGFGLTVAEGMAAGIPVLVPDSDGPYEIIQHGKLGYSFKKGDVNSLASSLFDIYEHYEERASFVVGNAYSHVLTNYSIHRMVDQYIEEYNIHKR